MKSATLVSVGLCLLLNVFAEETSSIVDTVKILRATRNLNIASQLVEETVTYEIENGGSSAVSYFVVAYPQHMAEGHLAIVEASSSLNDDKPKWKVEKTVVSNKKDAFYRIVFPEALKAGQKLKFDVLAVFVKLLQPYPAYIQQSEQQNVVYEGYLQVYSAYPIKEQKTAVQLPSNTVESYTKPAKQEGQVLNYGPYSNAEPYTKNELKVHYENNSPFLVVSELTRVIEISHWGNIAVEETLDIYHGGAKLKGSFSRYDFQRDHRQQMPAVKSFKTILPASAADVYYRDEIGNISTSNLRTRNDLVELEIRPRFPLFGGWKTHYYIGYNLNSYEYLYNSGNNYVLKQRFIDHIFNDFVVEKMTMKVILPEGARDIKLETPFPVKRSPDELHYTYLDVSGRPVVIVHKENLVENHIQDFELSYSFDRTAMIREPLMVIIVLYLLFLVVIVYVRLDFTIAKDASSEARLKVSGLVEQALSVQGERTASYDAWETALEAYKKSHDTGSLSVARKNIENDLKKHTQALIDLQTTLKADSMECYEKIGEVQKLDKVLKEQLTNLTQAAERLVGGKLQRPQFLDLEKQHKAKIEEQKMKIDQIMYSL